MHYFLMQKSDLATVLKSNPNGYNQYTGKGGKGGGKSPGSLEDLAGHFEGSSVTNDAPGSATLRDAKGKSIASLNKQRDGQIELTTTGKTGKFPDESKAMLYASAKLGKVPYDKAMETATGGKVAQHGSDDWSLTDSSEKKVASVVGGTKGKFSASYQSKTSEHTSQDSARDWILFNAAGGK